MPFLWRLSYDFTGYVIYIMTYIVLSPQMTSVFWVYSVGIHNYARANGRTATLTVSSYNQPELLTRRMTVQDEELSEDGIPTNVLSVVVSDDE